MVCHHAGMQFVGTACITSRLVTVVSLLSAYLLSQSRLQAVPEEIAGRPLVLTYETVANPQGDGPDGRGNTADDTWQFWFELMHAPEYRRLDRHSSEIPQGIQGKVRGPVASMTPNPAQTDGWIYHRDWDGRFEGVWGDAKAKQVLVHPYNEKTVGGNVAITCAVPINGTYIISGKVTDVNVAGGHVSLTGITYLVEVCAAGEKAIGRAEKVLASGKVGDGAGPATVEFKIGKVALKKGQFVRLVIDPNKSWATDMTRIEGFSIVLSK
jgi:hypothetical protein